MNTLWYCILSTRLNSLKYWLIDCCIFILLSRERCVPCAMVWTNPHPLRSWTFSKLFGWRLTSSHVNLLLVRSYQAEKLIVKRHIQGSNFIIQDIQQMQKDMPRKKFLETLSFVFSAKTAVGLIHQRTVVLAGRTKLRASKNFFGRYLFAFVECLCNCNPKIKTKIIV